MLLSKYHINIYETPPEMLTPKEDFFALFAKKRRGRERPQTGAQAPGTSALTKLSPEGATEHITCLITTCLGLCRPFGASLVVALLPGACAPVCGLSSLRDLFSGQQVFTPPLTSQTPSKPPPLWGGFPRMKRGSGSSFGSLTP